MLSIAKTSMTTFHTEKNKHITCVFSSHCDEVVWSISVISVTVINGVNCGFFPHFADFFTRLFMSYCLRYDYVHIHLQMYTPTYNVLNELLTAIDLNEGFKYLPRVWSGMYNYLQ